jgi:DNA-binding winged helix-turn-helix (wHTH) protein
MALRFGPFTLDLDQRRLLSSGQDIPLTPKAFELLKLLVERRPRAISKDEIIQAVWKDTFVTENNVATTIRDLRDALADDARTPRYIRTSYAYGYAFVAAIASDDTQTAEEPGAPRWLLIYGHREIHLKPGENVVGRSGADVLAIDSVTVSRHHARLTLEGSRLFCEDLGSKNGTWVQSRPATTRVEVHDGDELRLGSAIAIARLVTDALTTQTVERPRD